MEIYKPKYIKPAPYVPSIVSDDDEKRRKFYSDIIEKNKKEMESTAIKAWTTEEPKQTTEERKTFLRGAFSKATKEYEDISVPLNPQLGKDMIYAKPKANILNDALNSFVLKPKELPLTPEQIIRSNTMGKKVAKLEEIQGIRKEARQITEAEELAQEQKEYDEGGFAQKALGLINRTGRVASNEFLPTSWLRKILDEPEEQLIKTGGVNVPIINQPLGDVITGIVGSTLAWRFPLKLNKPTSALSLSSEFGEKAIGKLIKASPTTGVVGNVLRSGATAGASALPLSAYSSLSALDTPEEAITRAKDFVVGGVVLGGGLKALSEGIKGIKGNPKPPTTMEERFPISEPTTEPTTEGVNIPTGKEVTSETTCDYGSTISYI